MAKQYIYKCAECGSTDIEFRRWYNPNNGALGVDCEDDECWCRNCEEHHKIDVVEVEDAVFDGSLGISFKYKGSTYQEVIYPQAAESDPDLEGIWRYPIDTDNDNIFMVLHGSYTEDGLLSTHDVLQVRVQDLTGNSDEYIDDIDVVGADDIENNKTEWITTLKNQSLDEREDYNVVILKREILTRSIEKDGADRQKLMVFLRKRIEELFNGNILEYFNYEGMDESKRITEEDIDYCIRELAIGHASNIAGEDFWWHSTDIVTEI